MVHDDTVTGKDVTDDLRVDLGDDKFGDNEQGEGCRTRVKDLSDVIKSRVPDDTIVGSIGQEHDDIDAHHDEDPVPILEQVFVGKAVVINQKHGYHIGQEEHHDIKEKYPSSWQ